MTWKRSNLAKKITQGAMLALPLCLSTALYGEQITHSIAGNTETWRIDEPTVTQKITEYPQIRFQAHDGVLIQAGGCVQTGGSGLTWKRYVDPSGPNSDHLYHGLLQLPSIHSAMARIASAIGTTFTIQAILDPAQNFLRLGYEDDNYGDNGYGSHDDGTGAQCKNVGSAYVVVNILHNVPAEDWVSVGSFGIAIANHDVITGQVNTLAIHPRDANTIYIGAAEGGVWKTTDGGTTWTPLTDLQLVRALPSGPRRGTLSIGALAIDPDRPETVYAGTGDPNVACCFVGSGLGAFRSTDSGSTWTAMGADLANSKCDNTPMSQTIVNKLLVYPGAPATVYAATNVGLFSYREDGSDCWKYGPSLPFRNASDMVSDNFQGAIYAAFSGLGIYKLDVAAGGPWKKLTMGLPASGFNRIALAFGGRTGLGFSTPLPLVYAGFNASGTYRLFKTINGGDLWSELPPPPSEGQLDFNNTLEVGLYDSDELYLGQIGFWRTSDGGRNGGLNDYRSTPIVTGKSWTNLSCCLPDPNPFRQGLDLHGDNHQIAFASVNSFTPSPSQLQIFYVVNDGGITKGTVDYKGVVTWKPLSLGLAIGQCGTIGLNPQNQLQTACGLWHNGNAFTDFGLAQSAPVGGGDGFQTTIDAGTPTTVYFNCNAGFGGTICRSVVTQYPALSATGGEMIWGGTAPSTIWSDPYRPGHLLRLQAGLIFRTQVANTAAASVLNTSAAWDAVDPFWGKTGNTTTVAFANPSLAAKPIYYLGTDSGQIWRGSPEAGWTKLCECGPAPVVSIGPDLTRDRMFAAFVGPSPGRIKQLSPLANGTWLTEDIDVNFLPDQLVTQLTSVVVDPASSTGSTLYVGTDQGVYRGQLNGTTWSWVRSVGVPNVWVTDLEVNQGNPQSSQLDVVRAGTYGRGIFELRRFLSKGALARLSSAQEVPGLSVEAIQVGEDGAPPALTVKIPVTLSNAVSTRETPFRWAPPQGTKVSLKAPREIQGEQGALRFIGWAISGPSGQSSESRPNVTLKVEGLTKAVAYYEPQEKEANEKEASEKKE
jgi:hypothetical protein